MKSIILNIYLFLSKILSYTIKRKMLKKIIKKQAYKKIPIYIISYNRLSYLKNMVSWLQKNNYKNITIIDNNSDYQPLLDYYKKINCKIIKMKKNYGYKVFYKNIKFLLKRNFSLYVVTDPDLYPIEGCKTDFLEKFVNIMYEFPTFSKVGFSLKIDDIPDTYKAKKDVLISEKRYYSKTVESNLYDFKLFSADLDTTFALNSPNYLMKSLLFYKGIRTGRPYTMKHLPWYENEINEEQKNYYKTMKSELTFYSRKETESI